MGRLLAAYRPDLGLLLIVACHSGQGLDWGDFEVSSAGPEPRDVASAEDPRLQAAMHDPGSVPGVAVESPNPLPDVPSSTAPVEMSVDDQTDDNSHPDAGGYPSDAGRHTGSVPSSDDADAGDAGDGGNGDNASPTPSATQICPVPGGGPQEVRLLPDGTSRDCWAGETWELGRTFARGTLSTTDGLSLVGAYLLGGAASAKTQVYDADGNPLPGCVVVDDTADRRWREIAFEGATCQGAAFARVTAHASPDGDL